MKTEFKNINQKISKKVKSILSSIYSVFVIFHKPNHFRNIIATLQTDRTLTLIISNKNKSTAKIARIFGSTKDLRDALLDPDITILCPESSHFQIKTELLQNPFRIIGLKYIVSNASQLRNLFKIHKDYPCGESIVECIQPLAFRSAINQLSDQIDIPKLNLLIDKDTYIDVLINPDTEVSMIFTVATLKDCDRIKIDINYPSILFLTIALVEAVLAYIYIY